MSDFPIGNVDFVRQEESTASSVKLSVYFSAGDGYYQMVKFRTRIHISGSGIDKTVYANEWTFGPILNYVDSYQKWQFITIDGLPSGKTFMCVATLLYCVYEDGSSNDTSDLSGDWKTTGKTCRYVTTTVGMPDSFNWNGTNYSRYHGYIDSGYATRFQLDSTGASVEAPYYFNATAEQTQKAYKSITTGGLTTDFLTRVWNDIVDRVSWVQEAWGYKQKLSDTSGAIGAAYLYDIKPIYRQQPVPGGMLLLAGSAMNADVFNQVINAIPIVTTWPWEKELGRKNIKSGDICKGSYFIALVNVLNRWISLVPVPFAITDSFSHSMAGKVNQLPSVPFESGYAFKTTYNFSILDAGAISVSHSGKIGSLSDIIDLTVENGVLPFASQFNFFDFNTEMCKAASVDACVIGEFNGTIKQPTHAINMSFADTLLLQNTGHVPDMGGTIDLTAPQGCVIGDHSYTLHTQAEFQIGAASSLCLEHNGIFGVVNTFTLTPKDNDQSVLEGTIGIIGTVDEMLTEPGVIMDYSNQFNIAADFAMSSSTGNVMDQDMQIRVSGEFDFTASTIIPLELDGNMGMSATVDDMRIGNIYEIPNGFANVSIEPVSEATAITTIDLGTTIANVGVSVSAENNSNSPIELTGDVNASIDLSKSALNSQKDVSISGSVGGVIKSDSEVNTAKYQIIDGSANVSIEPVSEATTNKPAGLESHEALLTERSTGELVRRPFVPTTGSADITSTVGADMDTLNMARTRAVSTDTKILSVGAAEMDASKGQKDAEIEQLETISTEAVMTYKVPTALSDAETVKFASIAEMDKSSGHILENESEPILVRSEASVTLETVSLILASELDDTLISELDDKFAYDAERIIRITENDDSNTK